MQIQKGLVKYKDRSDIVCTYGLTDDGKQYYFLDGNTIPNGYIIASTVLVEAIDPVVAASSIGVIDANGNVIIPFENKSIKLIAEGLLLVERANSTTPSVVEANQLRSDPLAATKLVTTPAAIKDKMNAKMGGEGRFVFNDQFSEATICDINGNNLINNEYFSFIAIKNTDTLYFSKNTVESEVVEYSLINHMFVAPPEPLENVAPLDIQSTDVTQATIDGAMANEEKNLGFGDSDITAKDFEAVAGDVVSAVAPSEEAVAPVENHVNEEIEASALESVSTVEDSTSLGETLGSLDTSNEGVLPVAPAPIAPVEENIPSDGVLEAASVEDSSSNEDGLENISEPVSEEKNGEENSEVIENEQSAEEVASTDDNITETAQEEVNEVEKQEEKDIPEGSSEEQLMSFDFGDDNDNSPLGELPLDKDLDEEITHDNLISDLNNDLFDVDLDSDIFADSTLHADKIDLDSDYSDFSYKIGSTRDTIIEDVASTMSNLINLNRTQKQKIANYEEKFEKAAVAHKKIVEKARSQIREIESLKAKIKNYDTIVAKLEGKLQVLENKVHDQDKVIASQTREIETLRPQVEGKEELAKILADAQSFLQHDV